MKIKAIITDFDGTLANTFNANYLSYKKAFESVGYNLPIEMYKECFGLRYDDFIHKIGMTDKLKIDYIKYYKKEYYKENLDKIIINTPLYEFIKMMHNNGIKTAIASTANKENLMNVLNYFNITDTFDIIISGNDVIHGKPNPEIYLSAMNKLDVTGPSTLVFEDSDIGIEAATLAGTNVIKINI